jgi:nicotinate-nucleotide adenylyltransferase
MPAHQPWRKAHVPAAAYRRVMTRATAASLTLLDVTLGERGGKETSISLLIGAAKPVRLDTWRDRQQLFDYAHIAATKRPSLDFTAVTPSSNRGDSAAVGGHEHE